MSQDSLAPEVIYKPIENFPGYRVGSDGSVWTCLKNPGGRRRSFVTTDWARLQGIASNGYLRVDLRRDGKTFRRKVHRLVLLAFVGPCPHGKEGAHENGVRNDNRLSNLAWKTKKDNAADKIRHGTMARQKGERHGMAKLNAGIVSEIRARIGERGLAAKYGVSAGTICDIQKRRTWTHV